MKIVLGNFILSISSDHSIFFFENWRDLGNGQNENILISLNPSYVSDLKSHVSGFVDTLSLRD